jgi:DNA polymerase III gamma/tau subunit
MFESKDTLRALVVNKKEYVAHLCDLVTEHMVEDFQEFYEEVRKQHGGRNGNILIAFQDGLARIPQWNHEQIHSTYNSLCKRCGCNYLGELVKAILICYVKITMLANNKDSDKISLRIPSIENFMHKCYIATARNLWKRPHLLYHNVRTLERQHNITEVEAIVVQAVRNTLRSFVPMDQFVLMQAEESVQVAEPPITAPPTENTEAAKTESSDSESESDTESTASATESESESTASASESESESESTASASESESESESTASASESESDTKSTASATESESSSESESESKAEPSEEPPQEDTEVKTVTIHKTKGAFF